MINSILLFLAGVIAYSIKELHSFGKLKWIKDNMSFWGKKSYNRKYKTLGNGDRYIVSNSNKYYRLIKSPWKERWFTSTWLTVAFTDGFHLMQALAKIFICYAFYPLTNWWFPVILWIAWGLVFTLCDKYLTK